MKRLRKLLLLVLSAVMSLAGAAGCGGTGTASDSKTLKVMVTDAGFGLEWMYAIAEEFEAIYDVTVKITPTAESANELTKINQDLNDSDLFFCATSDAVWDTMRRRKMLEINDVWSSKAAEDETLTIAEKALPEYADAYRMVDGNYYSLPFILEVGTLGYNKKTLDRVFGEDKWKLPRTTVELTEMCEAIRDAGCYGFAWSSGQNSCYWGLTSNVWEAQYDGSDAYNHAWQGEYYDEASGSWKVDPTGEAVVGRLGKLRASQAMFEYVNRCTLRADGTYDGGFSHQYCSSMTFIQAQTAFVGGGYGEADKNMVAFTSTGSWLFEESKAQIEQYALGQIGCMKTPVISSLSEQLSYYGDRAEFDTLGADEQKRLDKALAAIIDYVDGAVTEKPTVVEGLTITDADIERVREARGVAYLKDQAHAFILASTDKPDLAKDFLRFFCSDYAGSIYTEVTHGFSPFYIEIDETNKHLNDFDKTIKDIVTYSDNKILPWSRLGIYLSSPTPEANFFNPASSQYGSPEALYAQYQKVNTEVVNGKSVWETKLENAGLKLL